MLRDSKKFKKLTKLDQVFRINEFITLKLIFSKTLIYVCDDLFLTCQKVSLNISLGDLGMYGDFDNIDDIIDFYKSTSTFIGNVSITPEQEFWAHCSNMQAWVESKYDSRLLTKSLSFPILAELSSRGILIFQTILKEEILYRIKEGGVRALLYFIEDTEENYLKYLSEDDLLNGLLSIQEADILREISRLIPIEYTLTTNLKDSRHFSSLRDEGKLHFCVEDSYITELEILLDDFCTDQYLHTLLRVRDLKSLKILDIYITDQVKAPVFDKYYLKSLISFEDLYNEFRSLVR